MMNDANNYISVLIIYIAIMLSLTSINDQPLRRSKPIEFQLAYNRLNEFIEKVNEKIVSRVQLVQQVYLGDYKEQVTLMSNELKAIRETLDAELLKQRANQRLFYLEEERDFFRAEVTKLNEELVHMTKQNEKLRKDLDETKSEMSNYKAISYNFELKMQKMREEALEWNNIQNNKVIKLGKKDELPSTQAKTDHQQSIKGATTTNYAPRLKPSHSMRSYSNTFNKFSMEKHTERDKALLTRMGSTTEREEIIDACIKEVKKQIFYRTLKVSQAQKIYFDQSEKVQFNKFTKTDKKQLIFQILLNERLLQQFYEFLFEKGGKSRNQDRQTTNTIYKHKLSDSKFNTTTLNQVKTEFNKKIFDLKANMI